jgi:hypothetical protein
VRRNIRGPLDVRRLRALKLCSCPWPVTLKVAFKSGFRLETGPPPIGSGLGLLAVKNTDLLFIQLAVTLPDHAGLGDDCEPAVATARSSIAKKGDDRTSSLFSQASSFVHRCPSGRATSWQAHTLLVGALFSQKAEGTTATELDGHGALPPCLFLADLREDRVRRLL